MDVKEAVLRRLADRRRLRIRELIRLTGISRQALHKHIKYLIRQGKLQKFGETRGAWYGWPVPGSADTALDVQRSFAVGGLQEHEVWEQFRLRGSLPHRLNRSVLDILKYAFTEILNNAIEHSRSKRVRVRLRVDGYTAGFEIDDSGLGIFRTIRRKFGLPDEYAALRELLKGKTTTAKKGHTGEGIFFTSKAADRMEIASHKIGLIYDNIGRDIVVKERRHRKGTGVSFEIGRRSKRRLDDIFSRFAGKTHDFQFSKTSVAVKLYTVDRDSLTSRSEARRLLHHLDRFKEIVLDFEGVHSVGQAFTDELFRVFRQSHPDISLTPTRANPAVSAMIRHVQSGEVDNR